MGKQKYLRQIESLFSNSPVVNYASIERIIRSKRGANSYVKRLINELLKRKKIKRLTKGYYTALDEASLIVFCLQPAYLGLQDALSFHGLWEQETIPVILTTRNVRQGIRKVLGINALVRRIKKRYMFGIRYHQQDKIALPYSDIEKTFIDMIYFKQYLDKETKEEFIKRLDKKRLNSYLKVYPKRFRKRVLDLLNYK